MLPSSRYRISQKEKKNWPCDIVWPVCHIGFRASAFGCFCYLIFILSERLQTMSTLLSKWGKRCLFFLKSKEDKCAVETVSHTCLHTFVCISTMGWCFSGSCTNSIFCFRINISARGGKFLFQHDNESHRWGSYLGYITLVLLFRFRFFHYFSTNVSQVRQSEKAFICAALRRKLSLQGSFHLRINVCEVSQSDLAMNIKKSIALKWNRIVLTLQERRFLQTVRDCFFLRHAVCPSVLSLLQPWTVHECKKKNPNIFFSLPGDRTSEIDSLSTADGSVSFNNRCMFR